MRARVGDLAIARFDPDGDDNIRVGRWNEKVCLVTGTGVTGLNNTRCCYSTYWENNGTNCRNIILGSLPPHRLVRARPKNDDWEGTLSSLTIDNVVPVE